jgi:hypothetical protein
MYSLIQTVILLVQLERISDPQTRGLELLDTLASLGKELEKE